MKVNRKRVDKKLIIIPLLIVILLTVGYTWYSHHYQLWPFLPKATKIIELNNSDSTNNQKKASTAKPVNGVDNTKTSSDIPVSKTTTIEIVNLSQNGNTISYSAHITNPASTGVCNATFAKQGSRTLVYDTTTSNADCGLSSIPANDFDSIGSWTLTLRYYSDNTQTVATSTLEVK